MAIKRYTADKSATITNSFKPGLQYRATGSNTGKADSMEIFSIYGQQASASVEKSRCLVQFPITSIIADRTSGDIPASGSVFFHLRVFNAAHPLTLPSKYNITIQAVSRSWDAGHGLDIEEGSDLGYCNWEKASSGSSGIVSWTADGGDYHALPLYSHYIDDGDEDVSIDITSMVEEHIAGTKTNYGLGIRLSSDTESALSSSYTKRFYTQGSEYYFRRPHIEARWDSSTKDQRANFLVSSSLAPASDNTNTIYFYNYIRGRLTDVPAVGTGAIYVQVWDDAASGSQLTQTPVTGGYVSTGIYSASFALNTTSSTVYDRWHNTLLAETYHTGTISMVPLVASNINPNPRYAISMPYLRDTYSTEETARFRLFTRDRNWCPNVYTVATNTLQQSIIENTYYKISRVTDDLGVVAYGTGSINHTRISYDISGSYFDLDMSLLEPGYAYEVSYVSSRNTTYYEHSEKFRFRVE